MAEQDAQLAVLQSIQNRILWLAVRMVDYANSERGDPSGVKVGGHQASSASMVGIMTSLFFNHLDGLDLVAVKPHASPVLHAVNYLIGDLSASYLTRFRESGGLQAYPSRTKDPDRPDYSTGSVGLGAVAPLFSAATWRYLRDHGSSLADRRFVSLVGDAELDEGNVWEAIADPALEGLGNFVMVVDMNRQSLDHVVPTNRLNIVRRFFEGAGWHVVEAKYGQRLEYLVNGEHGEALAHHLDRMSNEVYQSMIGLRGADLRETFLLGADKMVESLLSKVSDDELWGTLFDLGGHDLRTLKRSFVSCDEVSDRPSVIFAYTIKGWGLPFAGQRANHAALLTREQISQLRDRSGLTPDNEWDRFDPDSEEGRLCNAIGSRLQYRSTSARRELEVPVDIGSRFTKVVSTQEAFGRTLSRLASSPELADRVVTTSPDVSVSTSLGGWINKVGIYNPQLIDDPRAEGLIKWEQSPAGRHIELGISEMNLFLMLGQLGLAAEHLGETLLPIGTVYDPFVLRGSDALVYSLYNGARFLLVGTPSGVSLASEGGAHQSSVTASLGTELPNIVFYEPSFAKETEWILLDSLHRLSIPHGDSSYLRLTTRPIDQTPFDEAYDEMGEEKLRSAVLSGGYLIRRADRALTRPLVNIFASGAVIPEAIDAHSRLADEGVAANVVSVTSQDRLYAGWRMSFRGAAISARATRAAYHLQTLIPPQDRAAPIVSVHDAASHSMAWFGSAFGVPSYPLGVDGFGQSGRVEDLYREFDLLSGSIVNTALLAITDRG